MFVSICISTFKRPEGLRTLIEHLQLLQFPKSPALPRIEIVVADNEALPSTRSLVEELAANSIYPIVYVPEPRRGISFARNASVAGASSQCQVMAFIDDDSTPDPFWLDELLQAQLTYQADAVVGPLHPLYPPGTPAWVVKGGFFAPPSISTGTRHHTGATNNCLISATLLRRTATPFDLRFAMTGGEDANFFMRLHQEGYKIVWCHEAKVYEEVPASRASAHWICQRGRRCWASHSMIEKELKPGLPTQAVRALKGVALIGIGGMMWPLARIRGEAARVSSRLSVARGLGTLDGLRGAMEEEYKVIHTPKGVVQ
jgi:succinoglycan biosynthesis protein ExoM